MSRCAELRVLFRAAAGPRQGYGHLVRCRSLARALGVRPLLCVRGPEHSTDIALSFGCDVVRGSARRLLRSLAPDVLVVDDPDPIAAAHWVEHARRTGIVVASVHEPGFGYPDADVVIDGNLIQPIRIAMFDLAVNGAVRSTPRSFAVASVGDPPEIARCIATVIARRAPLRQERLRQFIARHAGRPGGGHVANRAEKPIARQSRRLRPGRHDRARLQEG